jgi:hypothetical protein
MPPTAGTAPGTTSTTKPNITADRSSRPAITVFASRPIIARVATIPSNATAAAATSASPMPIRLWTPSPASTAISVAPAAVATTPSQPTRSSRCPNNGRARRAPSTG